MTDCYEGVETMDAKIKRRYALFALCAILVTAFDQLTKYLISSNFVTGQTRVIIKGVLSFTYILNEGAAFGIMKGRRIAFILITVIVFAAFFFYFRKYKPTGLLELSAGALILSGAVGNLIDRVWLGQVRDFIEVTFISFPIFNVADCAICVGAVLVIVSAFLDVKKG